MIPEIAGALSATYNAAKMAGGLLNLSKEANVQQIVIDLNGSILELQGKVLGVQTKYEELAAAKQLLEAKLGEYQRWDAEAMRYQLFELAPGMLVYALNPERAFGEPPHYLCPNCFQQRKKAILHHPSADHANYVCDSCKFDVRPTKAPTPMVFSVRTRSSRSIDGL